MSTLDSTAPQIRPCVKCGSTDRYEKGDCKPCTKIATAKWYAKNKEVARKKSADWYAANTEAAKAQKLIKRSNPIQRAKESERAAKWRAENPEKLKAYSAAWNESNKDKKKKRKAIWHLENPDASKIAWQNRRAKKLAAGGKLSKGLAAKLTILQRGMCPCCGNQLGESPHLDHKMPLSLGGSNTDDNIQLLRAICNLQKKDKHPIDFMQSRGFLL